MSTVATLLLVLVHANPIPVIGFPCWSYPTAVNCWVPLVKMEGVAGVAEIVVRTEGGGSTVRDAGALNCLGDRPCDVMRVPLPAGGDGEFVSAYHALLE